MLNLTCVYIVIISSKLRLLLRAWLIISCNRIMNFILTICEFCLLKRKYLNLGSIWSVVIKGNIKHKNQTVKKIKKKNPPTKRMIYFQIEVLNLCIISIFGSAPSLNQLPQKVLSSLIVYIIHLLEPRLLYLTNIDYNFWTSNSTEVCWPNYKN